MIPIVHSTYTFIMNGIYFYFFSFDFFFWFFNSAIKANVWFLRKYADKKNYVRPVDADRIYFKKQFTNSKIERRKKNVFYPRRNSNPQSPAGSLEHRIVGLGGGRVSHYATRALHKTGLVSYITSTRFFSLECSSHLASTTYKPSIANNATQFSHCVYAYLRQEPARRAHTQHSQRFCIHFWNTFHLDVFIYLECGKKIPCRYKIMMRMTLSNTIPSEYSMEIPRRSNRINI